MKFGVASGVAAVVCALAGAAWAAGDPKACAGGDKKACIEIGTALANDEPPVGDVAEMTAECGKTKDTQTCAALLREETKASCRKGNQRACEVLGSTEAERIAEETAPSREALDASCKKKDQQACVDLATRLMRQEQPTRTDLKRAMALLERSCKANFADACAKLGLVLVFDGKKSDGKRGDKLLKHACDLGSEAGCKWVPPQPKLIKPGDKSMGPGILGVLKGDDIPVEQTMKNMAKLGRLLEQNCKLGYADACAELEEPVDPDPAKRKISTSAEIAEKVRKLEKQAAAGPAKK
jgi:TPR repeat protein